MACTVSSITPTSCKPNQHQSNSTGPHCRRVFTSTKQIGLASKQLSQPNQRQGWPKTKTGPRSNNVTGLLQNILGAKKVFRSREKASFCTALGYTLGRKPKRAFLDTLGRVSAHVRAKAQQGHQNGSEAI